MSGIGSEKGHQRRFKPYPAYKGSGVEWLGEVPAHWEVKPNGVLFEERDERGRDDLPIMEVSISTGVRVRKFSDTKIEQRADDLEAYKVAETGDIAFNKMRMWQGAVGVAPEAGLVSPDYVVARPRPGTESTYYAAVFRIPMYMAEVYRWSHGIVDDRNRLYWDDFKAIRGPVPSAGEQRAIASFVDLETARIDALVAKKERLIELLQEKRTALITRAVTKGLDPNVPLKDSGVEWLGKIPARWEVKRLSLLLKGRPRNGVSPAIGPVGVTPTFSTAAVNDGVVMIQGNIKYTTISPREAKPFLVLQGDVLLLRGSGSRVLVGRAGIVTSQPPEGCIYPDILIRVRPGPSLTPWFLVNCLNSAAARPQIEMAAKTAAGIWKITGEDVRGLVLPVPPYPEQLQIEMEVSRTTATIEATIAKVRQASDYLKELRTALISAAVTGKIDVREEVANAGPNGPLPSQA